jgi:hypothetical protein
MDYYILTDDYTEIQCNKRNKLYKIKKDTPTMHILEHVGYKYLNGYILMQPTIIFNTRRAIGNIQRV